MRDIQDWCISRQLWWGHRIPAWYDEAGKVYVGRSEAAVRETHGLGPAVTLHQDPDVLETWFSSALWTFGTLGWPEDTDALRTFHPTDVLVTGHDIIFFWVARMIMMTLKFTGEVPFKTVYIHGLVRDAEGQKMSKSKGNGLDPLDLIDGIELESLVQKRTSGMMQPQLAKKIEKATRRDFPEGIPAFGTDALRFTFCALASTGRDVRFDLARISGYRNFCNKLWNAASYVLSNTESTELEGGELSLADRWIRSRLQGLIEEVHFAFETFRFDVMAQKLYDFTWHEYCDWYLELTKPVLREGTPEAQAAARRTLLEVLETLLRLMHPIMPFLTETLWRTVAPRLGLTGPTLMTAAYPQRDGDAVNPDAEVELTWLKAMIEGLRTIRGEMNLTGKVKLPVLLADGLAEDDVRATRNAVLLKQLAGLEGMERLPEGAEPPPAALALVGSLKVLVPLAGLIDPAAERARLEKAVEKRQGECQRIKGKLGNERFVAGAPAEVVEKEREKLAAAQDALDKLQAQLEALAKL
jgi:valyl-tRNA synthetase